MGLNPIGNPEWPQQTAALVERVVGAVRSNTTDKLVTIVRFVVYGLLMAIAGFVAMILVAVIMTRALQKLIGWFLSVISVGEPHHARAVWISYLLLGGIFLLAGLFAMGKRHSSADA